MTASAPQLAHVPIGELPRDVRDLVCWLQDCHRDAMMAANDRHQQLLRFVLTLIADGETTAAALLTDMAFPVE